MQGRLWLLSETKRTSADTLRAEVPSQAPGDNRMNVKSTTLAALGVREGDKHDHMDAVGVSWDAAET